MVRLVLLISTNAVQSFFEVFCFALQNQFLPEGETPPFGQVMLLEGWIAAAISVILSKASVGVVLIVGRYDALITPAFNVEPKVSTLFILR